LDDLNGDEQVDVISGNAILLNRSRVSLAVTNGSGTLKLKWPAHAYSGTPESAALGFNDWLNLTNRIHPEGTENTITLPTDRAEQFFRLRFD